MILTIIIPFKDRVQDFEERVLELRMVEDRVQVLFVDDASSDGSLLEIDASNLSDYIALSLPQNLGRLSAVKKVMPMVLGDFISIFDSDDAIDIESLLEVIEVILPACLSQGVEALICENSISKDTKLKTWTSISEFWNYSQSTENKEFISNRILQKAFSQIQTTSYRIPTQLLWCHAFRGISFSSIQLKIVEKKYLSDGLTKNIFWHKVISSDSMKELYAVRLKYKQYLDFNEFRKVFFRYLVYSTISKIVGVYIKL